MRLTHNQPVLRVDLENVRSPWVDNCVKLLGITDGKPLILQELISLKNPTFINVEQNQEPGIHYK